ncbi:hypothetical protein ICN48_13165 [Polynucleobacter sp. JS-Safj-400b-B2]|uniref:hypothetical protein n=1 Tax=Polynucleobacter sp. JS-Safj-400b-B2 TaxID=2576921 RepID=UPI001C0E4686|nr:hypothetical protein [Polynucleobacter sp. JS-Safj-400b-B2]MBU3627175.1 hypothetical protein [Polynucleobacter sp. JS-Safj-400b-B2]
MSKFAKFKLTILLTLSSLGYFAASHAHAQPRETNKNAIIANVRCDDESLQDAAAQVIVASNASAKGKSFIFSKVKTVSLPAEKQLLCSAYVWMVQDGKLVGGQFWKYGVKANGKNGDLFVDPVTPTN